MLIKNRFVIISKVSINIRKTVILCTLFSIILIAIPFGVASDSIFTATAEVEMVSGTLDTISYIVCSEHYDYGKNAANQLHFYFEILDCIYGEIYDGISIEDKIVLQNTINQNMSYYFKEELEGFADGLNSYIDRDVTSIYALYLVRKAGQFLSKNSCTTSCATEEATLGTSLYDTYLTQNLDIDYRARAYYLIYAWKPYIVRVTSNSNRYAFIGMPFISELRMINDKGLGFGGNALTLNESGFVINSTGDSTSIDWLEKISDNSFSFGINYII